jgi:hypothetical protein
MEEYLVIDAADEEELMEELQQYSTDTLKIAARCISRLINNKLHGNPLYGAWYKEKQHTDEPPNADWEHQEEETTWTIQNYMQYNSGTNNLTVNTVCQPPTTMDEFMDELTCFGHAQLGNLVCPPVMKMAKSARTKCASNYQALPMQEEQDMYNEVQEAKRHLEIRAENILRTKNEEIAKVTNLNPPKPKTGAELKQWLKDGNYHVDFKDDRKIDPWCDPSGYVRLGPAFDEEKYNALQEQLRKDKTVVKDAIYILPPADALKALQEFEARTYS